MTAILQWAALVFCAACTLWRLPALVKGRNRRLFWVFALVSVSVALSIPSIYLPVDGLLGGINLANVVLRLCLFAAIFLVSAKIAAAYKSPLAAKLIQGPWGISVLVACSAGILTTYLLSDVRGSSTGLWEFASQPTVIVYAWFGRAYLAYAAACLVPPTARAALTARRTLNRVAALCMCGGFTLGCLPALLQLLPLDVSGVMGTISFGAILLVAIGLALVWVSFMRHPVKP
jgi:hypothetical protein